MDLKEVGLRVDLGRLGMKIGAQTLKFSRHSVMQFGPAMTELMTESLQGALANFGPPVRSSPGLNFWTEMLQEDWPSSVHMFGRPLDRTSGSKGCRIPLLKFGRGLGPEEDRTPDQNVEQVILFLTF